MERFPSWRVISTVFPPDSSMFYRKLVGNLFKLESPRSITRFFIEIPDKNIF
jgi:hypothetical protein